MRLKHTEKRCFYCEREFGSIPINNIHPLIKTADHIHPVSKGGIWHKLNIIPACHKCNSLKCNKTLEEFEQFIDGWIKAGYQTKKGYTQENLKTIKRKIKKLYSMRGGYIIAMQFNLSK
jgi:5-methylcytosine-specific restriction endonuclease McrA